MSIPAKRVSIVERNFPLPAPRRDGAISLEKALYNRRSVREFVAQPLEPSQISQLAWAAQGVTGPDLHRTAPSAGALYPLELYVVTGNVNALPPGVYKYDLRQHGLSLWLQGDKRRDLCEAALSQSSIVDAAAVFAVSQSTKEPRRSMGSGVFDTFIWRRGMQPRTCFSRLGRSVLGPSLWERSATKE